jgi:hypothetical protein
MILMGYPIITREMYIEQNINGLQKLEYSDKYLIINFIKKTTGDDRIPHYDFLYCS